MQSKLAKGVRVGKPENVIWILKWVGECPPTYVLPARIAEYRYANGASPEGHLVNLTEQFGRPRDDAERVAVAEEKQEALV